MKHVWILNHYAQVPGSAGGTRHYSLARHLLSHGWSSSVIAASVELNTGLQRLASGEIKRLEVFEGVPFLWVRTPTYKGNNSGRIKNMLVYTFRVLMPNVTHDLPRPDIIIGSSVHPFAALAGLLLARLHQVPFVFEVRDLWPQTLIDMGHIHNRCFMTWLLRQLELLLYRRSSRIVVLLPKAVDYIAPLGIPAERVVWIPNGVDISAHPASCPPKRKRNDSFVLMYFGAHGQANGLDNILRAMKLVSEQVSPGSIKLRMVGDGPLKPDLIRLSEKLALRYVSFEPPVPKKDIPALAAEADAFVFNLVNVPVFRYGISSNKLFDFMAGTRPIIFCCDTSNNPVEAAHAGITVPPGDPGSLAQAILKVSRLPADARHSMGCSGRRYVEENHDYIHLAGRLAEILDACILENK